MKRLILLFITVLLLSYAFRTTPESPVITFLNALDTSQLKQINLPFNDSSRETWHYLPAKMWERAGLSIGALNASQQQIFTDFLLQYLSETGYQKTQQIISLEDVLVEIGGSPNFRNREDYYIAIYGNPKEDKIWAWSFGGHHLSLNFTIIDDKITTSPRFFGANPATILSGKRKGKRTLAEEEDVALKLINALTVQQQQKAIFEKVAYRDIVTTNDAKVNPLPSVGILAEELNDAQQLLLQQLIVVYLAALPTKVATAHAEQINREEFADLCFGWAGATIKNKPHYYRIQGQSFLIEFDNTQNNANHIHTVWRDFNGDFGRDLIREHYLNAEHHRHD